MSADQVANPAMAGSGFMGIYELMVANAKGNDLKSFFAMGHTPIIPPNTISSAKAAIQADFSKQMQGFLPPGATISASSSTDVTVSGCPGFSFRFTVSAQGESFNCDMTAFQNGSTAYLLLYMGQGTGGQPAAAFQKVLVSAKFRSAPAASMSAP